MVRKTLFLLLITCFVSALPTSAQTIQWLVKPNYDTISHLGGSIFKCKTKDRVQLVDLEGNELLDFRADSVTDFNEGLALVLENGGKKIKGIIKETGTFTKADGEFVVNQYSYFSEQLVSVCDFSGKAGYLDDNGKLVIPCNYRVARPFINGWASVEPANKKPQTLYIDHLQRTLRIKGFHHGKVIMGSSFNSLGRALVSYYGNDNAIIDTKGNVVGNYEKQEDITPVRAYDFAFVESGADDLPAVGVALPFNSEISTFTSGRLIGYKQGEHTIAPPQFNYAGPFVNGYAIVSQGGRFGIVRYVEGSFSGVFEGDDLVVAYGKEMPEFAYTLEVPESLADNALQVMFDVGDGNMHPVSLHGNRYQFTPFVEKDDDVWEMKMQVLSDGLLLWADSLERNVMNVSLDIGQPTALSERANEQDELRISCVITNNSDAPINMSGAFSATFAKGSRNKIGQKRSFWGRIAPKGSKEVFVDLIVVDEGSAKVSITVKANQKPVGTKSANIHVIPFY